MSSVIEYLTTPGVTQAFIWIGFALTVAIIAAVMSHLGILNFFQFTLQSIEVGKGQPIVRIIPLVVAIGAVGAAYDYLNYHGLNDAQSMDNAQLARQIYRHAGFTTLFLRPHALAQLRDYRLSQSLMTGGNGELFPSAAFPPGRPRIIPDTYNAPGYPYLLSLWFHLVHPDFSEAPAEFNSTHGYAGDRWIPPLNQIFMLLTAIMVFILGRRLFDSRIAWFSLVVFFSTDLVWHYSVSALSTTFLMFLITGIMMCLVEIFSVGEACFESEVRSFAPAWLWSFLLALLLAVACLTRLHLLVLLVPLIFFLMIMPQANFGLPLVITLIVAVLVTPWFVHEYKICGNPLGSNMPLFLLGQPGYEGNQIYCVMSLPGYEQIFDNAGGKELTGFRWHFDHAWSLLGASPAVLFFVAAILHPFKRRPTRLFQWWLILSALALITANNLGDTNPAPLGPWNVIILLLPGMIVVGSAFFFLMLDRLDIPYPLLRNLIVTIMLTLTALPLIVTATAPGSSSFNYPPYSPPIIKLYGQFSEPDEWVTTDMPWATAWYAERPSLWLPDTVSSFENLHDNFCPTGILLLTPVSWGSPLSTFTTGEYKEWFSFACALPPPADFPLTISTLSPPGWPEYHLWSDRPRWQAK